MTVRKVWLGSTGPFLYDDSILYIDEDGVISPDNQQAIATDGQIVIQSAPSSPVHAVRKQDLDDALGDITSLESRIAALEATVASHTTQLGDLNGTVYGNHGPRLTTIEGDLVDVNNILNSHHTSINSLNGTVYGDHEPRIYALEGKFFTGIFSMSYSGWVGTPTSVNVSYVKSGNVALVEIPALDGTSNADHVALGGFPADLKVGNFYNIGQIVSIFTDALGSTVGSVQAGTSGWDLQIYPTAFGAWANTGRKLISAFTLVIQLY